MKKGLKKIHRCERDSLPWVSLAVATVVSSLGFAPTPTLPGGCGDGTFWAAGPSIYPLPPNPTHPTPALNLSPCPSPHPSYPLPQPQLHPSTTTHTFTHHTCIFRLMNPCYLNFLHLKGTLAASPIWFVLFCFGSPVLFHPDGV